MFLSEQIKDLCSMLLQWLVVVNRGRPASHISIAVGNDSLHIVTGSKVFFLLLTSAPQLLLPTDWFTCLAQ